MSQESSIDITDRSNEAPLPDLRSRVFAYCLELAIDNNPHRDDESKTTLRNNLSALQQYFDNSDGNDVPDFTNQQNEEMHDVIVLAETATNGYIDDLTGVLVSSGLEQSLQYLGDDKSSYYLLFMDLDRFKMINDNYGHSAGDQVLQKFAEVLYGNVRHKNRRAEDASYSGDERRQTEQRRKDDDTIDLTPGRAYGEIEEHFGRHGGDEFAVIVQTDENGVESIISRLTRFFVVYDEEKKQAFSYQYDEDGNVNYGENPHHADLEQVTVSIGSQSLAEFDGSNFEEMITGADKSMYEAKLAKKTKTESR